MRNEGKRIAPHRITYESDLQQLALNMARARMSNRAISRETGMTDCQINYLLHKAKTGFRFKHGFRVRWSSGEEPLAWTFLQRFESILQDDIESKLIPLYVHPTPKVVETGWMPKKGKKK